MPDNRNVAPSIQPSIGSLTGSLRELSSSTIAAAIRSQTGEEAEILRRANICLANYFDPDLDPETRAGIRESFVRALREIPLWAVLRAFDAWERTMTRRPSPGDIHILAGKELKPMTDELARRHRIEAAEAEERRARDAARCSPEAASEIMNRAGFTPKRMEALRAAPMATSFADAETKTVQCEPHWTERVAPDDPRMEVLRAARAKNPLMAVGMKP